ncbi:hypothetical protein CY35_17G004400 [Sphagnum magellanicum]|nr:hypothetical protein CY35_17G004400 [Sphagnum magellanicum]KAH9534400.1 hypothetical protein CY35_17G004400 [Sphagnum magellanicum]KAH9534401.1 hypothetical protein CY35_17G004400 [Sphagnum magellanicum]KAH9534402.1 hypothetical protein CY35_17G004400 [Sphagnum magellanicum]
MWGGRERGEHTERALWHCFFDLFVSWLRCRFCCHQREGACLPIYPNGDVERIEVSKQQLLRSTVGLRLQDIQNVDPALWITNSAPTLLVRDQAILLNFGSLRAIATPHSVLVFDYKK